MNKCRKLETQWTALCWGSRTVSLTLPYRSPSTNNHYRFGQQVPANWECLWQETFWSTVDIAWNCGDHTTGDQAESKSVNTSSQSGTRHPKDHCVTNLALHTEGQGLSHPGAAASWTWGVCGIHGHVPRLNWGRKQWIFVGTYSVQWWGYLSCLWLHQSPQQQDMDGWTSTHRHGIGT